MRTTAVKETKWKRLNGRQWEFNNILMGYVTSQFRTENETHKTSNDRESVRLHMGLKGDYSFKHGQLDRSFELAGGHHNIMYSRGLDLEVTNKSLEIETFGIDFPKEIFIEFTKDADDLLKEFSENILIGKNVMISEKWGTINSPIQCVIDEIILNQYSGSLQKIFLLAKTLELLVLCVDNYKTAQSKKYNYLKTKQDKEAIIAARDFINKRISSPPNLSEIARAVGVNEFKLKYGFKEMFNSTIFSYLTEKRLNLAKQYLLDTESTIAEISEQFGYSSPQHFSSQFKQRFGKTPNSVRRAL